MWQHGGDILTVKQNTAKEHFIDFSANINPLGQPKSVQEAIISSATASLNYPDPFCRQLKQAIEVFEQVDETQICCGNGAAEVIFKLAYATKPKSVLIPAPTFAEYEQAIKQVGAKVNYFHLKEQNNFTVSEAIVKYIKGNQMVFVCNPNNPVGNTVAHELIEKIAAECKKQSALLVLDECFMNLVENHQSAKRLLKKYSNLIILKAFTKSFAIPGIRLGYCLCSDVKLIKKLEKTGPPWSVSTPAQLAGVAACGEQEFLQKSVQYIAKERGYLLKELEKLKVKTYPSETNFVLFYVDDINLREKLIEKGIIIRDCSNYIGLKKGFYRVAVRTAKENKQLVKCLEEVLWQAG